MSQAYPPSAPAALVVDDNPRWRALIGEILGQAGWVITASASLPDETPPRPYDLLVVDPGGVDILRQTALPRPALGQGQMTTSEQQAPAELQKVPKLTPARLEAIARRVVVVGDAEAAARAAEQLGQPPLLGVVDKGTFTPAALLAACHLPADAEAPPPAGGGLAGGPRILVVEDDANWRALYGELLEDAGCRAFYAVSYGEGRGWLQRMDFDLAIVDLNLASSAAPQGNRDGFYLLRAARQRGVPTIVVSALGDPADVDRAYDDFGIFTFIEKEGFDRRRFRRLLDEARQRRPEEATVEPEHGANPLEQLTPREMDVLSLLIQGMTNRQIAETLLISPNTTKKHVDHILQKLGVGTRAGAVAAALQAGLKPGPMASETADS